MKQLDRIQLKLAEAQSAFLRAADSIPADRWTAKPGAEAWSAAEVVAHLMIIERAVLGGAAICRFGSWKRALFAENRPFPLIPN